MTLELKIKTKHLAAESRIIKSEEAKLKNQNRKVKAYIAKNDISPEKLEKWKREAAKRTAQLINIKDHRRDVVRREARSTHLAYGFLRGTPYSAMENSNTRSTPDWRRIEKMVCKYSKEDSRITMQRFAEWRDAK